MFEPRFLVMCISRGFFHVDHWCRPTYSCVLHLLTKLNTCQIQTSLWAMGPSDRLNA